MLLSAILPGLGQLYLAQFAKGGDYFFHLCFSTCAFLSEFLTRDGME